MWVEERWAKSGSCPSERRLLTLYCFSFLPFLPEGCNENPVVVMQLWVVLTQKQFCPPPPLAPGNTWRHILLSHDRGDCCWHLTGRDAVKYPVIHRNPPLPNKELLLLLFSRSVTSGSLWPHGLKPARLLCPWDSPGKNTGMGCHALLQGIFLTQGLSLPLLHWQVDSLPLNHQSR